MTTTTDYKFWVSLSTRKFDHKPDRETEVKNIRFQRIYTDVDGFAEGIAKGYCYAPIFTSATFGMTDKTDANFCYSSFVSIDIDHTQVDMNTMVDGLVYKPTLSYTSCSNGENGKYSYRLIYCFNDEINSNGEYANYVHTLLAANQIPIDDIDKRSIKASQYYNGNGCGNINFSISNIIYDKTDFIDYYKDYISNVSSESINITHIHTHHTIMTYDDTFNDKQFESDYWSLKMEDILVKYLDQYPNIEHTPLPVVSDDTPYIMFPTDYIEIRRYWTSKDGGRAIKLKDKEGRRRKLFINGIIRRKINPSITFDNLLYNLLYELVYYVSNYDAENIIDKREIYNIARSVMKADLSRSDGMKGTSRKFMVNPYYCAKHGVSRKKARVIASRSISGNRIGELYDCSKTDKENLELMKQQGLEISLVTLKRWRKENGIVKYKKKLS